MTGTRSRRGINLIGLLVLLLALGTAGLMLNMLARQSGKSSHWFHDSQSAYNLADAAFRETYSHLVEFNSKDRAQRAPCLQQALKSVYRQAFAGRGGGTVEVMTESSTDLPPAVKDQLETLRDFSPRIDVALKLGPTQPLASVGGPVPVDPCEKKGSITLVAHGSVKNVSGIRSDQTITVEKSWRLIRIVPPVLGRFALFVHASDGLTPDSMNPVGMRLDRSSGQGVLEGGARPLTIQSDVAAPLVASGSSTLSRKALGDATAGLDDFLDRQGWIYLGGPSTGAVAPPGPGSSAPAGSWMLQIAHGWGEGGDSPQIRGGTRRVTPKGAPRNGLSLEDDFLLRFKLELQQVSVCEPFFLGDDGLFFTEHGWASNYEIITLDPNVRKQVENPPGQRIACNFAGAHQTSFLRPFGSPQAFSPTLVFGPVMRSYLRRAAIKLTLGTNTRLCPMYGSNFINLMNLSDHKPKMRRVLQSAFDASKDMDYSRYGTGPKEEPLCRGLPTVLDTSQAGFYNTWGNLHPQPAAGTNRGYRSALLPWWKPLTGGEDVTLDAQVETHLWNGELRAPRVFDGKLPGAFSAFRKALDQRLAYVVAPDQVDRFLAKVQRDRELRLPGVVLVKAAAGLSIGPVERIVQGGILINEGPIRVRGSVLRGPEGDPLTLVATAGDVTLEPAASKVEAYLAALEGKVVFGGEVTLVGGLAAKTLDIGGLTSGSSARSIRYDKSFDRTQLPSPETSLQLFYGGEDRVAVTGGVRE